jgi:hypothetical protein
MSAPRKRLTTQKLARHAPAIPLAPKHPKSIATPENHRASQVIENKATSQKSIATFCALRLVHLQTFPVSRNRQINRHTFLLAIAVTHGKQKTSPFLIDTRSAFLEASSCLSATLHAIPFHAITLKERA